MRDQYAAPAEYGSPTLLVESGIWHILLLHAKCGGFGEVSIIITLDWEKHIRVVKLCMTFESGPE